MHDARMLHGTPQTALLRAISAGQRVSPGCLVNTFFKIRVTSPALAESCRGVSRDRHGPGAVQADCHHSVGIAAMSWRV